MKSEGQEAEELSLQRIEMTRSSGKESNKSVSPFFPVGINRFFFRQTIYSPAVKSCLPLLQLVDDVPFSAAVLQAFTATPLTG